MREIDERPSFIAALLDDWRDDVKRYGTLKIVPIWILLSVGLGVAVAYTVPDAFWRPESILPTSLYAALLTVNSLLLALCMNSFSRIYEAACAPGFSKWLQDNGILNHYFFFVDYIQYAQIVALSVSGAALISTLYSPGGGLISRTMLAASIATIAYSLRYAVGSVTLMQDLVWYRAQFEGNRGGAKEKGVVHHLEKR